MVKKALSNEIEKELLISTDKLKKIKDGPMKEENFEKQAYIKEMTLNDARINFKIRTHMLDVKFNYKNDKKFSSELWRCDSCQTCIESQNHVLWCPAYRELREDKDISNNKDLIEYMKKVLLIRDKLKITK